MTKGINPHLEKAKEYERMAEAIADDPDWMANAEIDDDALIEALKEAAKSERKKAK
jgi:nitrogenase subunit NifH